MQSARHYSSLLLGVILFAAALAGLNGCGTPGAPQPPSLRLPTPVDDLTATRIADIVTLHWTTPQKNTDRLPIQGLIGATLCRREPSQPCHEIAHISTTPGAVGNYQDRLPNPLLQGPARSLTYSLEFLNLKGRSAGPSNLAIALAGAAPGPIADFHAELRPDGVALHWQSAAPTSVRLHRLRVTLPPVERNSSVAMGGSAPEPPARDLFVEKTPAEAALDTTALAGQSYEYSAQRVNRLMIDGKSLELAGEFSAPIRVDVADNFPPGIPHGLVAVFFPEEKTIDLSWQPDTEADLAGYVVYRRSDLQPTWQRISGPQPLPSPAYRDQAIEAGRSYRYAITAIDQTGHESSRSVPALESVPNP